MMATVIKSAFDRNLTIVTRNLPLAVPASAGLRIPAGRHLLILDDKESLALQGILNAFLHEAAKIPDFYPQDYVELGKELSEKLIKATIRKEVTSATE